MEIKEIASPHSETFKRLNAIRQGKFKAEGLTLIEGRDLLDEAKRANCLVASLATRREDLVGAKEGYILPAHLLERLSVFSTPAGIMGIAKLNLTKETGDKFIYLDGVQDPGNVGTIIRTALCFGYTSVMVSKDSASLSNIKTIQASKGAIFRLPVGYMEYEELLASPAHLYLTILEGQDEREIPALEKPCCLVFGNEGRGIPAGHRQRGTGIRIDMGHFDSLNVASAAAIFMYRFKD